MYNTMDTSGDRGTQIFISPQEVDANKGCQPDSKASQTHHTDGPTANKLQRKKAKKDRTDIGLTGEPNSAKDSETTLRVRRESPWTQYKKILTMLDLGGEVILSRKKGSLERVGVRIISKDRESETLTWLRKLRHCNIVATIGVFATEGSLYVINEEMHLPLEHIVRSTAFPVSKEIATIAGQVLDGLAYLEAHGLTHGSLSCENVLLHETGSVKIAKLDMYAQASSEDKAKDLKDLATITMRLMQKYALDGGKVGVENLDRWRDSAILDFLSSITSATGASQLRKNSFLEHIWRKGSRWPVEVLCDLITVAQHTVPRCYRWTQ